MSLSPAPSSRGSHKRRRRRQRTPARNTFYYRCPRHRDAYVLSFIFEFDDEAATYLFAYSYPYTYTDLQERGTPCPAPLWPLPRPDPRLEPHTRMVLQSEPLTAPLRHCAAPLRYCAAPLRHLRRRCGTVRRRCGTCGASAACALRRCGTCACGCGAAAALAPPLRHFATPLQHLRRRCVRRGGQEPKRVWPGRSSCARLLALAVCAAPLRDASRLAGQEFLHSLDRAAPPFYRRGLVCRTLQVLICSPDVNI